MPKRKTMRRLLFITASLFIGFFSVALYSCDKPVPPEPSTAPVDGTWQSISDKKNSEGAPQFVLTLNLKFENSNISGNYCFITRYGKKSTAMMRG